MRSREFLCSTVAAIAIVACSIPAAAQPVPQPEAQLAPQAAANTVAENELGGVVRGPNGPEAGVWVIAETTDLPTRFAKIVVTDDQGRYLIPDLPGAKYSVWVRGYGLVDSDKLQTQPGNILDLTAVPAETPADAAQFYPPI